MKKGDCIILTKGIEKFGLVLYHSPSRKEKTEFGFIIIGEIFKATPSKEVITSCGILGDKYQNEHSDLLNSSMRIQQKYDKTVFYTGVKYDVITIPQAFFNQEKRSIENIANIKLNPQFYPLPNFYSRQDDYDEICELIKKRILKRDKNMVRWSTIYDAYPLSELLIV